MEHPKISAILIHKEDEPYPEIILERLDINNFFDEILIVNDCPSVYHRYLAAAKARNEIIYFQDSDCMVNAFHLFKFYNGQITNAMTKEFIQKYKDKGCTLVGWGCYFQKSMLGVFDRYIAKYGENDPHLLREADRIFTFLNGPNFNTIQMPHEDLFQTPDRMGYQPEHYTSMDEALEKCKAIASKDVDLIEVLSAFGSDLFEKTPKNSADIKALFDSVCLSMKASPAKIMPLLRVALTGDKVGPDLMLTMEIIGSEESANRIQTFCRSIAIQGTFQ